MITPPHSSLSINNFFSVAYWAEKHPAGIVAPARAEGGGQSRLALFSFALGEKAGAPVRSGRYLFRFFEAPPAQPAVAAIDEVFEHEEGRG